MSNLIVERTEHGWIIDGKTRTERRKQVRKVPIRLALPLAELRQIQRNKVCSGCGGKISLRTYNNFDCQPNLLFCRNQYPVCLNDQCSRGIEWGVEPREFRLALAYVKKHDYRPSYGGDKIYTGYGKGKRYNYYYLSSAVSSLIDLKNQIAKHFDLEPKATREGSI